MKREYEDTSQWENPGSRHKKSELKICEIIFFYSLVNLYIAQSSLTSPPKPSQQQMLFAYSKNS